MKHLIFVVFLFVSLCSCGQKPKTNAQTSKDESDYPLQVSDIAFDPAVDDPNFKVCDETNVYQYYNFANGIPYIGEKPKLVRFFNEKLKTTEEKGETGYVTIRFVVNCEGKTGRFRVQEMDMNYQPRKFGETLTKQLLELTKQLEGWFLPQDEAKAVYDYYQYLTFKIENGKLTEILP
jgi:hypothetical protein